jgi:streptomycin 6-kinase
MSTNLNDYLRAWNLSDPQHLAQTPTSHVYIVTSEGVRAILKLLTPIGVQDEKNGAIALRYWGGQGAVHLLREDEGAHLLEYASGENLTELVKRGEDKKATAIIASVLNQLHAINVQPHPHGLTPLNQRFESLFNKAKTDQRQGIDSIYVRAARVAEELLAHPREVRVLHGDIHHYNIRLHPQRGWLAFDPKGLIGERTYDAANTLCNPDMPELVENEARLLRNTTILAEKIDSDFSRLLAFVYVYACLNSSWYLPAGLPHFVRMAELAEPHVSDYA